VPRSWAALGRDPPRSHTLSQVKWNELKTGPHIAAKTSIASLGIILKKITES